MRPKAVAIVNPTAQEVARFWSKVDATGTGCWPWTAHASVGYPRFTFRHRNVGAHRFALTIALGRPIAEGMEACHRCNQPSCVRPSHLYEGTPEQNRLQAIAEGRAIHRGHRNGRAKLTSGAIAAIRQSRQSSKELAIAYGVGERHIRKIRNLETWTT